MVVFCSLLLCVCVKKNRKFTYIQTYKHQYWSLIMCEYHFSTIPIFLFYLSFDFNTSRLTSDVHYKIVVVFQFSITYGIFADLNRRNNT